MRKNITVTNVRVAILGKRQKANWKEEVTVCIKQRFHNIDAVDMPIFCTGVSPSSIEFFPDGIERHMEAIYSQEKLIASRSDVIVFANDGNWSDSKKRHMKQLFKTSPIVIVWTPTEIKTDPVHSEDPIHSGIVNLHGDEHLVADIVAFLAMAQIQ